MSDAAPRPVDKFASMRARLLASLSGDVLEIGGGNGHSLAHYPRDVHLAFTEPDAVALKYASAREDAPGTPDFLQAAVPGLPFADATFDAVVEMRVLCSVPSVDSAIAEIRRVLRPGGTFIFMEHVRSPNRAFGFAQDVIARPWARYWGCWPNRDATRLIEAAGFTIEWTQRFAWGPPPVRPRVYGVARSATVPAPA